MHHGKGEASDAVVGVSRVEDFLSARRSAGHFAGLVDRFTARHGGDGDFEAIGGGLGERLREPALGLAEEEQTSVIEFARGVEHRLHQCRVAVSEAMNAARTPEIEDATSGRVDEVGAFAGAFDDHVAERLDHGHASRAEVAAVTFHEFRGRE